MVIDLETTPIEVLVKIECNAIIPLPHSNDLTMGTIASAVDMVQIVKDITVHGIRANQIMICL